MFEGAGLLKLLFALTLFFSADSGVECDLQDKYNLEAGVLRCYEDAGRQFATLVPPEAYVAACRATHPKATDEDCRVGERGGFLMRSEDGKTCLIAWRPETGEAALWDDVPSKLEFPCPEEDEAAPP